MISEIDDILADMPTVKSRSTPRKRDNFGGRENLWDKEYHPMDIDLSKLERPEWDGEDEDRVKTFVVKMNDNPPREVMEALRVTVRKLRDAGYTLLSSGSVRNDPGTAEAIRIMEGKTVWYTPLKGFEDRENDNGVPGEDFYRIACGLHKVYNDLPGFVKALLANEIRLFIGLEMDVRADLLLTWTEDGAVTGKECNVNTGYSSFTIKAASAAGVPVRNFGFG